MKWGMNGLGLLMVLTLISTARAAPSGLLNDTGQTQCLNVTGTALEECTPENSGDDSSYPGQDGRYGRDAAAKYPTQSGFTKPEGSGGHGGFAFTPLDVNGNPIPLVGDPPVPAETPRCVWDRVTNLIWEVKTDDGGLQDKDWTYGWGGYNTGNCYADQSPVVCGSNNYITALNAADVCPVNGAGLWRLPTLPELLSIVDHGRASGSVIDAAFFPNTGSSYYWSGTVYARDPEAAWNVDFNNGRTFAPGKSSNNHVRLVRSGPGGAPVNQQFADNGDGTVTDTVTGLMWDQCSWGQTFNARASGGKCAGAGTSPKYGATSQNWAASLSLANTANAAGHRGHNDWRLPNRTELVSLVNYATSNPAIDGSAFPNTPDQFWSSMVYAPYLAAAWVVYLSTGSTFVPNQSANGHVRLVRSGQSFGAFIQDRCGSV